LGGFFQTQPAKERQFDDAELARIKFFQRRQRLPFDKTLSSQCFQ
jgi:hypothetical protein